MEKQRTRQVLKNKTLHIAILSGGAGERLWPMSQKGMPKPFLKLPYNKSLLLQSYERCARLVPKSNIWIVTTKSLLKATLSELPHMRPENMILEPKGKNTAPACILATKTIDQSVGGFATVMIVPADHYVPDVDAFAKYVETMSKRASEGKSLLTFGMPIRSPDTSFGYIEAKLERKKKRYYTVKRFIEKPNATRAKKYAREKNYYWNSGMFCWQTNMFLSEIKKYAPKMYKLFRSKMNLERLYNQLPNISIDYALMEKSAHVEVVPAHFSWSDLGTWSAVYKALAKKDQDNIISSNARVVEGQGNFVRSESGKWVIFGLNDLVIVESHGVNLICSKQNSYDLKRLKRLIDKS
ncbi:MAG: mannose-1-phosphate guanylyltransferase [Bdellovibrionales bacterium]|nr:mannose-1-phosphate guanylyltransferase [Bdellovibrionales bacterium]